MPVLKVAGKDIDFISLHWYVGDATEASHYKGLDNKALLTVTASELGNEFYCQCSFVHGYGSSHTKIE